MVYAAVGNCSYVFTPQERHFMAHTALILGPFLLYPPVVWLLLGIVFVLAANYFSAFPKDSKAVKALIALILSLNILKGVQAVGLPWRKFIVNYGDYSKIVTLTYVERTNVICSTLGSAVAQVFLIHRGYKLSQLNSANRISGYIFLVLVTLAWLLEVGGGLWVTFVLPTQYVNTTFVAAVSRLPPAAHLGTDVLITTFTMYYLLSSRTGFRASDSLIWRLIVLIIQSAVPPMIVAALWLWSAGLREPGFQSLFHSMLPGLDAISVLYSLNSRAEFKHTGGTAPDTMADLSFMKSQTLNDRESNIALQDKARKGVGVTVSVNRHYDTHHNATAQSQTIDIRDTDSLESDAKIDYRKV